MRLNINLASRPYEDVGRFYLLWIPSLVALALITIALGNLAYIHFSDSRSVQRQLSEQRKLIDRLDKERSGAEATLNLPQNSGTRDQAQFLNNLFARKAFSWTKVLADLETIMPAGVQVISIKPEVNIDGQLQFHLIVATERREEAIELVRRMESSPRFVQAEMVKEQVRKDSSDPNVNKLSVEIVSQYQPPARKGTT